MVIAVALFRVVGLCLHSLRSVQTLETRQGNTLYISQLQRREVVLPARRVLDTNGNIEIVEGGVVACTFVNFLKVVFPGLSCVVFGILMVVVEHLIQLIADVRSVAYRRRPPRGNNATAHCVISK